MKPFSTQSLTREKLESLGKVPSWTTPLCIGWVNTFCESYGAYVPKRHILINNRHSWAANQTTNLSRSHTVAFAATRSCTVSNIIVQHRESAALRTLTSLSCPLSVSFCNLHIAFLPCITSHVFYNSLTFHSSVPTAESKAGAVSQLQAQYNQPQLRCSFSIDK